MWQAHKSMRSAKAGSYLNLNATTGSDGQAGFVLPSASYKFRVDLNGEQHWTETAAAADGQSDTVTIDISTISVSIGADPIWIAPGGSTTLTWSSDGAGNLQYLAGHRRCGA